jgi:hypothetical protein
MNNSYSIDFTTYFSDDDNDPLEIKVNFEYGGAVIPVTTSFGIFTLNGKMSLDIMAPSFSNLGVYLITVVATDTMLSSPKLTFKVIIFNTAPYFDGAWTGPLTHAEVIFNTTFQFKLPRYIDEENNPVTMIISSVPAGVEKFSKILLNEYIEFSPKQWKYLMSYDVMITLTDGN